MSEDEGRPPVRSYPPGTSPPPERDRPHLHLNSKPERESWWWTEGLFGCVGLVIGIVVRLALLVGLVLIVVWVWKALS